MKQLLTSLTLVLTAVLCMASFPSTLSAQKQKKDNFGKEFYVAFAENHGSGDEEKNLFALFITSRIAATGTVEVKGIAWSTNFTTTPGQITEIDLPAGRLLNPRDPNYDPNDPTVEITTDEQVVPQMAVHIISDNDIAVYGMNHKEYSSDAFMALPIGVLGTEYRTLCYPTSNPAGGFGLGGSLPGEFYIVAITDTTNVTITPKAQTAKGISGGTPIKVPMMNKGDVYLVEGDATDDANDLTGSLIESDQPIAVFSGHVRTEMPAGVKNRNGSSTSRDHLVEQLPPVSAWGDSALVVSYATASLPDLVRIVSGEDNNIIKVNGTIVTTLAAGDFYEIVSLAQKAISIQGTSPLLVGQYMHTSLVGMGDPNGEPYGDPAYSLIFPVEQFDSDYTFMLDQNPSAYTRNFINIVADPNGAATMMLDDKAPVDLKGNPFVFKPIPGSNYVYAQVELKQGSHHIYSNLPFGITAYALGNFDSYSYPGGSLLKTITPFKTVAVVIDFGDRVMTENPAGSGTYNSGAIGVNRWDTTVYLQNISSDPYTILGWVPQGGNTPAPPAPPTFSVTSKTPDAIGPGVIDSMTIEFTPGLPGTRFHTTIKAQTEHLRAYVVDVYGRGILPNVEIYGDSIANFHVDTIDFGIWQKSDPPKDSFVYLFNKGAAALSIASDQITGANAADFFIGPNFVKGPVSRMLAGLPVLPPFTLRPFNIASAAGLGALIPLEFNPSGLPNGSYQAEYDANAQGQIHKVILLATIRTILQSSVTPAVFDTAFICQDEARSIFVDNPNDFPITVQTLILGGPDKNDFQVVTPIPMTVDPSSRGEIKLDFIPPPTEAVGIRSATATLMFDLPKGFTDTIPLSAYGDQYAAKFWARENIHILPGESVLFPIYARSPIEKLNTSGFTLTLWYNPAHLMDDNIIQDNTLTSLGYYSVTNDTAGLSHYYYSTYDGGPIVGGSDTEVMPLLYIEFKSFLADGENKTSFREDDTIHYQIDFENARVPSGCILTLQPAGQIFLDSTCETVYLLHDTLLYPSASYIEPVKPNPVAHHATFGFDVPTEGAVRIDIVDMLGNTAATVLDEVRKKGSYQLGWDASNLRQGAYIVRLITNGTVKSRQIVVER